MGREKKKAPAPPKLSAAQARKVKRERAQKFTDGVWQNLNALKEAPKLKHKTYFESVENTEKKKKLDFQITTEREPPPGFEFVPTGFPELTTACKELSRDQDALFFIVSDSKDTTILDHHMTRVGCHFRQTIVEQARVNIEDEGQSYQPPAPGVPGQPEPIPTSQTEINRQADAVLRDLFPRIPNTDRHEIIAHAFKKDGKFHGEYKVGMAKDLTLARRVQLAALAHIRHTRTRYDQLLRETDYANARKAVEKPCLDIIVKWRGDEETGRDQLDEILREVIEISDTEELSEDESSGVQSPGYDYTERSAAASPMIMSTPHTPSRVTQPLLEPPLPESTTLVGQDPITTPKHKPLVSRSERRSARKAARAAAQRFRRYAAAADAIADEGAASPQPRNLQDPGYAASSHTYSMSMGNHQIGNNSGPLPISYATQGHRMEYMHHAPGPTLTRVTQGSEHSLPDGPFFVKRAVTPRETLPQRLTRTPPRVIQRSSSLVPRTEQPISVQEQPEPPRIPTGAALQDFLVPSVEPASPEAPPRQFYPLHERSNESLPPWNSGPYGTSQSHSRRDVAGDRIQIVDHRAVAGERRRVVTYFPEDYERPSRPTLMSLPRSDGARERALARHSYQTTSRRRASPPGEARGTGENFMQEPHVHYEQGSVRSRANPIMLDGDRSYHAEHANSRTVLVSADYPARHGDYGAARPEGAALVPGGQQLPYPRQPIQPQVHGAVAPYTNRERYVGEGRSPLVSTSQGFNSGQTHVTTATATGDFSTYRRALQENASGLARRRGSIGPETGPVYVDTRHAIAHYERNNDHMQGIHHGVDVGLRYDDAATQQIQKPIYVGRPYPQPLPAQASQGHRHTRSASQMLFTNDVIWIDD